MYRIACFFATFALFISQTMAAKTLEGPGTVDLNILSNACYSSGGSFDSQKQECICPSQRVFDAAIQSCIPLSVPFDDPLLSCTEGTTFIDVFFDKGMEGVSKCFVEFLYVSSDPFDFFSGTYLSIIPNLPDDKAQNFINWANQHFGDGSTSYPAKLWSTATDAALYLYVGDVPTAWLENPKDFISLILGSDVLPPDPNSGYAATHQTTLYEPVVADIDKVLAVQSYTPEELYYKFPLPANDISNSQMFTALRDFSIEQYNNPGTYLNNALFINGDSELGAFQSFSYPAYKNGFAFVEEKLYSRGAVAQRTYWALDSNGRILGGVYLSPNRLPNIYFSLNWNSYSKLGVNVETYDRNFSFLVSYEFQSHYLNELHGLKNNFKSLSDVPSGSGVLLCERIDPFYFDYNNQIIKGPYTLQGYNQSVLSGSVYGWNQNYEGDWSHIFGGYTSTSELPIDFNYPFYHGNYVASVIHDENPDVSFIVGGLCFHEDNSQLQDIISTGVFSANWEYQKVKVINVSYATYTGKQACNKNMAKFQNQLDNTIIVSAAGNYSEIAPEYCPQSVDGFHKVVVAAAYDADTDHPSLTEYTSFGTDYADIASTGIHDPTGTRGTSYAAPRVSAIAARISQDFPTLKPNDVIMSILASAYVPYENDWWGNFKQWLPLELRSGGVLRKEQAYAFASCVSEFRQDGNENPLHSYQIVTCIQQGEGASYNHAQRKYDFLKDRLNLP